MEILKEIMRIVTSKSDVQKVFPELDEESDAEIRDSLTGQFMRGMLNDVYQSDNDAAKALYGSDRSDQRYRTLKSRTYERLLHSVLFLEVKQPDHSEYLSYYYRCTRNLIGAQTLMRFASRTAGFHVAQKTLKMAQKYQFTDICVTLTALLRETVGFWGQKRKFEQYNDMLGKYFRTLEAEYESDALLDLYVMETNVSSRTRQYLINYGEETLGQIKSLADAHGSHLLMMNLFRQRINVANHRDEPQLIIDSCDEAIKYLEANMHLSQPARLGEFRLRRMMKLMYVRESEKAFAEAGEVVKSFREAGNNWYLALYFSTAAAIQAGRYKEADSFVAMATSHRKFQLQGEWLKESWVIFDAYVNLASRLGLYDLEAKSKQKQFRLSTFLNSVPEESKNKKVTNVLILIAQAYFLILDGKFDEAERRIEYLKVYGSRYLKEKHFSRVRIFLRMLQAIPRNSFNADDVRQDNEELYAQLVISQNDHMPSTINEYIPFETLYDALLNYLARYELEAA